ncbi:hypothetical protein QTJ16_002294 [Diplocarpon rosae]|uniref:Allergen n=1 Tax=Diplocarpon rosae TaxID=946125 RepID=A0AAD9WEU8_9HELO|nr:hypothetical protein QTJ16_002294 [Diplocarpon rosae]
MDKAKQAVSSFLSKDGKHDTTVHETVNPAVTNEHVTRTQHNTEQTAIDREVHQDHYHTSVQPIQDKEVLPEQHTHQLAGVEHRNIKHGNDEHVKERLAAEQAQFKNTRTVGETHHTSSANPVLAGEHVHHHVHENIQPVIQKETIQPSVVHTTVPVHEVHQNEAKHHTATSLPAVTMAEFQKQGGSIAGREERTDAFKGEPRSVGGTLGGAGAKGTTSLTENDSATHSSTHEHSNHHGVGHGTSANGTTSSSTTHAKPSLMDKLNPKVDADGDGKAGFLK